MDNPECAILTHDEFVELCVFTRDLPQNAALALAENVLATENPSPLRGFYTEGLLLGSALIPEAIEDMRNLWFKDIFEQIEPENHTDFSNALERYYTRQAPLPVVYAASMTLMESVRTWEALSDMDNFCRLYMLQSRVAGDDYRDLNLCLFNALEKKNLNETYKKVKIEFGINDRDFIIAYRIPGQMHNVVQRIPSDYRPSPI